MADLNRIKRLVYILVPVLVYAGIKLFNHQLSDPSQFKYDGKVDVDHIPLSKARPPIYTITWFNGAPPFYHKYPEALYCGFESCSFSNCKILFNSSTVQSSDAVIFEGPNLKPKDFFHKNPGQIWIFAAHEGPPNYFLKGKYWLNEIWRWKFNWTMTYDKSNADIHLPYGEIRKRSNEEKVQLNYKQLFAMKNKTALIIYSHCDTAGKREIFLKKLTNHLQIDTLGYCGEPWDCGKRFKHDNCFDIINNYKFYLAFENALCDNYWTEKLFDNFNYNAIMVVRGGRQDDKNHALPTGTYISTDDFKSIKELGNYLKTLSESEQLYTEFLRKKSQYYAVPYRTVYQRAMCDLCERMNKQDRYRKLIDNLQMWAFGRRPCQKPTDLI